MTTTTTPALRAPAAALPFSRSALIQEPATREPAKLRVPGASDDFSRVGTAAPRKRVVIVGGGFAGLEAAKGLKGAENLDVVLIDPRGKGFEFRPLLIHLATGKLKDSDVTTPQDHLLADQKNAKVVYDEASRIDVAGKKIDLKEGGPLSYDYLILATGTQTSYFGHDDWAKHTIGLKTVEDAHRAQAKVLDSLARASKETDPAKRKALLSFVIVGGGFTGPELAAGLAELMPDLLEKHPNIRKDEVSIKIVEAGPKILGALKDRSLERAVKKLGELGVEIVTKTAVTGIDAGGVTATTKSPEGGEKTVRFETRNVFWAAGMAGGDLAKDLGAKRDPGGRVLVSEDLAVPGVESVYVVGDLAKVKMGDGFVPTVAPAAKQEGALAARNILATEAGGARETFKYDDRGTLAVLGGIAVGDVLGRSLPASVASVIWPFIHIPPHGGLKWAIPMAASGGIRGLG